MSEESKPKTKLVIDPRSNDFLAARAVLDDILAVMKKHNCVLAHQPQAIVLARIEGGVARVLVEVRQVTPEMIESRRLKWDGKILTEPLTLGMLD